MTRRETLSLAAVVTCAALVRLAAFAIAFDPSLVFPKFLVLARRLIADGWVPREPFAYSPAYTYLVAALLRLGLGPVGICLVQVAVSCLVCAAVWALAHRLLDLTRATVAGLLAALYGPFVLCSLDLESDGFGLLFYCLAALALVTAVERPSTGRFALAGLLLGVRVTQRPNVSILVAMVLAVVWLLARRELGVRRAAASSLVLCLSAALPVLPVTWLNFRASGEPIPVMTSGGWVFYTSHNRAATGLSYFRPPLASKLMAEPLAAGESAVDRYDDAISRRLAATATGRQLSANGSSRFWRAEALRCVARRGVVATLRLELDRLHFMAHRYEAYDNVPELLMARALGPLPGLGMGVLAPLGLVGLGLAGRPRRASRVEAWLVAALIATPVLSMLLFYVGPRFRLELAAMLMPWAAHALCWGGEALRGRRWAVLGAALAVTLAFALLCNLPTRETRRQEGSRTVLLHTTLAQRADNPRTACFEYRQATAAAAVPAEAEPAYEGLARCSRALGDREAATRAADLARGLLPEPLLGELCARDDPDALWAVGRHLLVVGDPHGAAEVFARAVGRDPLDPEVLFARARASFDAGLARPETVLAWTDSALDLGLRFSTSAAQAHLLAARCAADLGHLAEAEEHLVAALRYEPDDEAARQALATVQATARTRAGG